MECGYCKIRAQSILAMKDDPRFRVFLFEDLVRDPLKAMAAMLEFGGLEMDAEWYDGLLRQWWERSNSSFGDHGAGSATRWHCWTSEQKRRFKALCGQELIDLGFEVDNDW